MFTAKSGAYIKTANVAVTITSAPANSGATITGSGTSSVFNYKVGGTYKVQVTDGFYCTPTVITITVNNPGTVTKWTAKTGLAYTIDAGTTKTLTLGDIFTLNNNYKVGTVTYKVDNGSAQTATSADWTSKTVSLGGGTHTVTITDDLFSNGTYTAEVKITEVEPEPTVPESLTSSALQSNVAASSGTGNGPSTDPFVYLDVSKRDTAYVTFNIGVPATGTYKLEAQITTSNGAILYGPVTATFDNGGTVQWPNGNLNSATSWTSATGTVNLTKGDHTVTIRTADPYSHVYFRGLRLVASSGTEPTPTPTPGATWESVGWLGAVGSQPEKDAWVMTDDGAGINIPLEPGEVYPYTTVSAPPYTGVYGMQLRIGSGVTTVKATTSEGYYGEFNITKTSWTSGMYQDQPLYFTAGAPVTIYLENTGSQTVEITGFDFGSLNGDGSKGMKYMPIVKTGGEIPTPDPTPTPTPGGSEPTAPATLSGADFVSSFTAQTNMSIGSDKAEFGYTKDASFTVKLGVAADGNYLLSALFSSNASYVQNSQVTVVNIDGVNVTEFPSVNKVNPNWSPANASVYLTKGDHTVTLSTKSSWNRLYIHGLKLELQ